MTSPAGLFKTATRSVEVVAVEVTYDQGAARELLQWIYRRAGSGLLRTVPPTGLFVDTPIGSKLARPGSYVVHMNGEFQVIERDLFHTLFEVNSD